MPNIFPEVYTQTAIPSGLFLSDSPSTALHQANSSLTGEMVQNLNVDEKSVLIPIETARLQQGEHTCPHQYGKKATASQNLHAH